MKDQRKHHMSLKHTFPSQPPKIHATLSASVAVCARKPWVGSQPQTGALFQYITGGGADSMSTAFGRRGHAKAKGRLSRLVDRGYTGRLGDGFARDQGRSRTGVRVRVGHGETVSGSSRWGGTGELCGAHSTVRERCARRSLLRRTLGLTRKESCWTRWGMERVGCVDGIARGDGGH